MKTLLKNINGGRLILLLYCTLVLFVSCEPNKTFINYRIQDITELNKIDRNVLRDINCYYQYYVVVEFRTGKKCEIFPDSILLEFEDNRCMACDIDVFKSFDVRRSIYQDGKTIKKKVFLEFRRLWLVHDTIDYENTVPVRFKILPCGFIKNNNKNVITSPIEFGNEEQK